MLLGEMRVIFWWVLLAFGVSNQSLEDNLKLNNDFILNQNSFGPNSDWLQLGAVRPSDNAVELGSQKDR